MSEETVVAGEGNYPAVYVSGLNLKGPSGIEITDNGDGTCENGAAMFWYPNWYHVDNEDLTVSRTNRWGGSPNITVTITDSYGKTCCGENANLHIFLTIYIHIYSM